MGLRVSDHAVDLVFGQLGGAGNGHLLFLACLFVLGGDSQDTIGVDIESDFHLGRAPRSRLDAFQPEMT
jgi:hypothetical protein